MTGLEDLYREIVLDHYRNPRNRGQLEVPPAVRAEGFNPLCGDEVVVYLELFGDRISDLKITSQGCSISQSSASMMSAAVKGKTLAEARSTIKAFWAMMSLHGQRLGPGSEGDGDDDVDGAPGGAAGGEEDERTAAEVAAAEGVSLGELEALQGVVKFPPRIKCATLSWHTLEQAMSEAAEQAGSRG
ncbi:MAG TPA: SUF system NifU family Fe-S cluster assembly protein [Acidimicrobiales bacterium]|nr:SUF system NifU family Fe-S cluster assembly protein [Acidimicrobiales bacterium]